eukprot:scaffold10121_cov112-Isochrysis_galbana.AAC.4
MRESVLLRAVCSLARRVSKGCVTTSLMKPLIAPARATRDSCPSSITCAAYCAEKDELPRWCQGRPRWTPKRVRARMIGGSFRGSWNLSRVQNSLFRVERARRVPEAGKCGGSESATCADRAPQSVHT